MLIQKSSVFILGETDRNSNEFTLQTHFKRGISKEYIHLIKMFKKS